MGVGYRVVSFKLDEETIEQLDEIASRRGVPRSVLIRECIDRVILAYGSEEEYNGRMEVKVIRIRIGDQQ